MVCQDHGYMTDRATDNHTDQEYFTAMFRTTPASLDEHLTNIHDNVQIQADNLLLSRKFS